MTKIRVLIVDDAVVIRKILSDELGQDGDIEVIGTAANGKIALQKIIQLKPDIVTLDIEMPEMDGLTTLTKIRESYPKLPVIMFSTLTEKGGRDTLEALSRGASDYVTKPSNVGKVTSSKEAVRNELLRKIKSLARPTYCPPLRQTPPNTTSATRRSVSGVLPSAGRRIDAVAIGVSTGGPNALAAVFADLPGNFPVPIFIVQHMPPMFTRLLAERLSAKGKLTVIESAGNETVKPGMVYIAPGDYHLEIVRRGTEFVTQITKDPSENSCRPSVDPLFRSASNLYGPHLLAVVMTGMGNDGMLGAEHVKERGGLVLAQDEATSVVWGMPGAVVDRKLADSIIPLEKIAGEISMRVSMGRGSSLSASART